MEEKLSFRPLIWFLHGSPLTLLRSRTMFGRPDFKAILRDTVQSIEQGTYMAGREAQLRSTVACYFCGPNGLAQVLKMESAAACTPTVTVTFAKEHF